jgi:translation elongation factor 2 (EF-2/EF-G)
VIVFCLFWNYSHPQLTGKALAMDFDKEEQERGITIYQANVTLLFSQKRSRICN